MSRFQRGLAEQDAVVGDNADGVSVNTREPTDKRRAVTRFEFTEFAAINLTRNYFMNIIGRAEAGGEDAVQIVSGE